MADYTFNLGNQNTQQTLVTFDTENIYQRNPLGGVDHVGYLKDPVDALLTRLQAERDDYKNQLVEAGLIEKELTEAEIIALQKEEMASMKSEMKDMKEMLQLLLEDNKGKGI